MSWCEHKRKLMKNPEFRKTYKILQTEYQYRREEARRRAKRQTDLARELGITVEELVDELFDLCLGAAERYDFDSEEIEQDIKDAVEATRGYIPDEGISVLDTHERMKKEGKMLSDSYIAFEN